MYTHAHFDTSENIWPNVPPLTPNTGDLLFDLSNKIMSCLCSLMLLLLWWKKLHVIFTQHSSRCREDKSTLPCVPRPGWIWTQLCQYSLSITSYFLASGVFLHLTEIFSCLTGYHSFCPKFSSSPSYSCLWPVLILRHTVNNERMASADGRISGALTGSHLLQEITYMHHARASPQARASHQAPTRRSAWRLNRNQKNSRESLKSIPVLWTIPSGGI